MLQKKAEDFVIATGRHYSIKDFIEECLKILNIKAKWVGAGLNKRLIRTDDKKAIIKINPKYFRPSEVNLLHGDASKAKKIKLKPKTNLKKLVKIMIDDEIKYYKKFKFLASHTLLNKIMLKKHLVV